MDARDWDNWRDWLYVEEEDGPREAPVYDAVCMQHGWDPLS